MAGGGKLDVTTKFTFRVAAAGQPAVTGVKRCIQYRTCTRKATAVEAVSRSGAGAAAYLF